MVPSERIIPYERAAKNDEGEKLAVKIKKIIENCSKFISSHSYDPLAEFGYDASFAREVQEKLMEADGESGAEDTDSLAEELKSIPDPRAEPLRMLQMLQNILDDFGPWCMDRALMLFAARVEEFRVSPTSVTMTLSE